jgi:hypothetical protein
MLKLIRVLLTPAGSIFAPDKLEVDALKGLDFNPIDSNSTVILLFFLVANYI